MSDKKQDVNAVTTESNVEDQDYIYTPVPQNKRYGLRCFSSGYVGM